MKLNINNHTKIFSVSVVSLVIVMAYQNCGRTPGTWQDGSSINGQSSLGSSGGSTNDGANVPIPTGPDGVDYSALESLVFKPKCSGCHSTQFASYASLMAAKTASGNSFIVAGSAQTSAVYIEISAGRMPKGVPLASDQIAAIRDWINAGAKPPGSNGQPPTPTPVPTPVLDATWTQLTSANGLMTNNCVGCHSGTSPAGGINLLNYDQAKRNAAAIKKAINDTGGEDESMPPSGPMIKAYRDTISSWVDRGAPQ